MKKRHVWQRSVSEGDDGVGRVNGTRADFIYFLFMMGFSITELAEGCCDGFMQTVDVEDAIRYGAWKAKKAALKGSVSHDD